MAAELDVEVAAFRNRPLDGGPYTYVSFDAMTQKVRESGRIVNVAVVIAVGVNAEGDREVLGFDVITTEDSFPPIVGEFVRRLRRGLAVAAGDAHIDAAAQLVGGGGAGTRLLASWQAAPMSGRAGAVGDRSAAALDRVGLDGRRVAEDSTGPGVALVGPNGSRGSAHGFLLVVGREAGSLAVGELALDSVSVPTFGRLAVDGSPGRHSHIAAWACLESSANPACR
jgi:hypothetical protein